MPILGLYHALKICTVMYDRLVDLYICKIFYGEGSFVNLSLSVFDS